MKDIDAGHGCQAKNSKPSGKFRKSADAVFIDEEGPGLAASGPQGQDEAAN